jgi:glutamate N-acetyltransferase/amino-acid N-acetyltransferase
MFNIFPIKGGVAEVDGFYANGFSAGFKQNSGLDVGFIYSDTLCEVEALFTTNKFQAAPIKHFKKYPNGFKTNFLLANSKNANAMTGENGIKDIDELLERLKSKFPSIINPVMSSTGVIGYRLNKEKISSQFDNFDLSIKESHNFTKSIMTTDRYPKEISFEVDLGDGKTFKIAGVAKGAGMINPAMATMLCFIVTDASIPKDDMREVLESVNDETFNAISVDGDTSTNDTVMLFSNAKSGCYDKLAFREALKLVMQKLAFDIVKDGEGSTKCVAFEVLGASSDDDAKVIAKALSNSLLVKTAIFGEDPNWGRIASTVGASAKVCDEDKLVIYYDNLLIYSKDNPNLDEQKEAKAYEIMKKSEYKISCNLNIGNGKFTSYGCDLGYEYVKINADYRT